MIEKRTMRFGGKRMNEDMLLSQDPSNITQRIKMFLELFSDKYAHVLADYDELLQAGGKEMDKSAIFFNKGYILDVVYRNFCEAFDFYLKSVRERFRSQPFCRMGIILLRKKVVDKSDKYFFKSIHFDENNYLARYFRVYISSVVNKDVMKNEKKRNEWFRDMNKLLDILQKKETCRKDIEITTDYFEEMREVSDQLNGEDFLSSVKILFSLVRLSFNKTEFRDVEEMCEIFEKLT